MSSFEKVPISNERQKERLSSEIEAIETAIVEAKRDRGERIRVKDLERTLKNKRAQLEKLLNANKKDDLLQFEQLGVDALFVDEAHKYKNKFIFTKMNNVAGISRAMSQRATDMDLKCEYIGELRGGDRGVTFATGTPISNSLVEMYTMQSYLQRRELKNLNLQFLMRGRLCLRRLLQVLSLHRADRGIEHEREWRSLRIYRNFLKCIAVLPMLKRQIC